ncbi:hypothetical protein BDW02DRAFT_577649 [Decorospora gaudefroyi]|uniref:Uncharacterized protein n=1 Tax=Decorospora gaudefroyi TaxID=184978 RepID=A0A6A5KMA0_9PLEO|nr:hypothetical protein BDW02DRAFT_577649 [Decorospora gaudefroyi]
MEEKREWADLVQRYSADELTYEKDRLVALEGVVSQIRTIMDGTYHFGLWTHMPELLLWMMRGPEYDVKGPEAPSWSFASRRGGKFYLETMIQSGFSANPDYLTRGGIRIDEKGAPTTTAPMLGLVATETSRDWIAAQTYVPWKCTLVPESVLLYFAHATDRPALFLFDSRNPDSNTAIGIATLDDASIPPFVSATGQRSLLCPPDDGSYVPPDCLPDAIYSPKYLEKPVSTFDLPEDLQEMDLAQLMKYKFVFDTSKYGKETETSKVGIEGERVWWVILLTIRWV